MTASQDDLDDASDSPRTEIPIEIIDAFDEAWFSGRTPVIEEFLPLVEERRRKGLLKELLSIEWDYRKRLGSRCEFKDYFARFPQAAPWLENHWRTTFPPEEDKPQHNPKTNDTGKQPASKPSDTRYRIEKRIDRGQFGEVFLAWDRTLSRHVALKIIRSEWVLDKRIRRRFRREAEVIGRLEHPCIIPIHDFGHFANGEPFYAMKLVKAVGSLDSRIRQAYRQAKSEEPGSGFSSDEARKNVPDQLSADVEDRSAEKSRNRHKASLFRWILRGRGVDRSGSKLRPEPLELRYLLEKFLALVDAVAFAHDHGIINRDIKPEHLILGSFGESFLVDWGMALVADQKSDNISETNLSVFGSFSESAFENQAIRPGDFVGTPQYCAPEQALGLPCNTACDIYSLGATLYHIMTGRPPRIVGPDRPCLIEAARKNDFDPPRAVVPDLDKAMEQVILKAMHSKPMKRYATVRDLGDDVRRWMADEPVKAWEKEPWTRRVSRLVRRNRRLVTISGMAMVALMAFVSWLFNH